MSQQPLEGQQQIVNAILRKPDVRVIDVGAGDGKWGVLLRGKVTNITALEVWRPAIVRNDLIAKYDCVINQDARRFTKWHQYDVAILGDVLEHMPRQEALRLTGELSRLSLVVFLTVPISPCPQNGAVYNNPYETHVDQWTHEELEAQGWQLMHKGQNEAGTVLIGTYELRPTISTSPGVTVIIPCGGDHARLVGESVKSCLNADPRPAQIIVVDDDARPPIKETDVAGATLLRLDRHRGRSYARNYAAKQTTTEWLFFLDADDMLEPTAMTDFARISCVGLPADLYFADYDWTNGSGTRTRVTQRFIDNRNRRQGTMTASVNIGMFVRRERFLRIGGFDEDMQIGEYTDMFRKYTANPRIEVHKHKRPFFVARHGTSVVENAEALMTIAMSKINAMTRGKYYWQWSDK